MTLPSRNRVTPRGDLIAASWRGQLMGNRGRLAEDPRDGPTWRNRAWITCRLQPLPGAGTDRAYTKLFFSDEAASLAAGHRPCAQCRRDDFERFKAAWARCANVAAVSAVRIDEALSQERRRSNACMMSEGVRSLPDGSFVEQGPQDHGVFLVKRGQFWRWSEGRYTDTPTQLSGPVRLLTPPSVVAVLREGYRPFIGTPGEKHCVSG